MRFFEASAFEMEVTRRVNWIRAVRDWVKKETRATIEPTDNPVSWI